LTTFVDTSAFYALLDQDDANHPAAARTWKRLLQLREPLLTHNYVLVESAALAQRRLGVEAVRVLVEELLGVVRVAWVDQTLHQAALTALLAAGRREVSLVDWLSFALMRQHGIRQAFAFDAHFHQQGFGVCRSD
jgi:predicted nucleic acid-binding protein